MAKVVQFNYYSITGYLEYPSAYLLKYPYFYCFTNNKKLYRVNVVTKESELYATVTSALEYSSEFIAGQTQNINTDLLYFNTGGVYGAHSLYSLDLVTLKISKVVSYGYSTDNKNNNMYSKVEQIGDKIYFYTSSKYKRGSEGSNTYGAFFCNIDGTGFSSKFNYSTVFNYNAIYLPFITDIENRMLLYCYETSSGYIKKVGFSRGANISQNIPPLNDYIYKKVGLFKFGDYYYGVGGQYSEDGSSFHINRNLIRIDPFSLESTSIGEIPDVYDVYSNSYPLIQNTNDSAYIILSNSTICILTSVEYNLTYKFLDKDNSILAELQDKLPIINVNVSYNDNNVSTNLTYVDGTKQEILFTLSPYKNFRFIGFTNIQNSNTPLFPIGDTVTSIYTDFDFYPSYSRTYTPSDTFILNLYKNKSEANRVDKTDYLTSVGTISGVLREESSITKPVITFESLDIPVFNYVYIPIFNRYYFVNDITSVKYKLWQISMSVDPLMTYKDAITQCVGFIDRNEYEFNAEIIDKKRAIEQGRTMEVDSVTNELFTGVEGTFSLSALNATAVNVE